jgi:hypothetical protein
MTQPQKKKSNRKPLEDEWVIQLISASEKAVKGYEKYLLDKIDYSDLAKIMSELREVLPEGCQNNNEENNDKKK